MDRETGQIELQVMPEGETMDRDQDQNFETESETDTVDTK